MERWRQRPEGSNWGDFGPDDRIGKMNLVTPERRRAAAAEVREGLVFCLSLPLNLPGYDKAFGGSRQPPQLLTRGMYNDLLGPAGVAPTEVVCDDAVFLSTQYSTQWDSLAHYGRLFDANADGEAEKVFYNGFTAEHDFRQPNDEGGPHALALGIEHFAGNGAQGRGVLVDLVRAYGPERRWIGYDDLMRAMDAQKVIVEKGDFLLLHTGFDTAVMEMGEAIDVQALARVGSALDGADKRLCDWIVSSDIVAICSDNQAVEGIDMSGTHSGCGLFGPLHDLCLFRQGIHLGELWRLSELAAWLGNAGRHAFLLTAPPLRLPGAVGSPVTPVATV